MNSAHTKIAQWSTASFGASTDTSPMDLESLQAHLSTCRRARGSPFAWHYSALDVKRFLSGRVISTVLVLVVALSIAASVL